MNLNSYFFMMNLFIRTSWCSGNVLVWPFPIAARRKSKRSNSWRHISALWRHILWVSFCICHCVEPQSSVCSALHWLFVYFKQCSKEQDVVLWVFCRWFTSELLQSWKITGLHIPADQAIFAIQRDWESFKGLFWRALAKQIAVKQSYHPP